MRKIEQQMIKAIKSKQSKSMGNTTVTYECGSPYYGLTELAKVYLHGHHIATYTFHDDTMTANPATLARWPTSTTKSRLRALGVNVYTKNWVTYLNGKAVA